MKQVLSILAACGMVTMGVASANADDASTTSLSGSAPQYQLHLGLGGLMQPKYPGADEYILTPYPIIVVDRLFVPGVGQVVDGKEVTRGFGFYPAFSFNGEREASDSPDLRGTDTIDASAEIGLGIRYRYDWLRGYVELRQGFGGHSGQVGRAGLEVLTEPTEKLNVNFGPRFNFGSDEYMETYFGVTSSEANAPGSRLSAFDPGAGVFSVGFDVTANYALTERTTLHFRTGWDRYVGDGADSPIVELGNENNFTIGAGLSYRFDFNVFR
ncbi:MAG: MipA/OmpV family protein [Pseudomonadota bacterium]